MWYFPMIRSAIDVFEYYSHEQAETLGSLCHPKIKCYTSDEALTHLEKLGLISKRFFWTPCSYRCAFKHRRTVAKRRCSRLPKTMVDHAKNAIDSIPREKRDISTLTLALDSSQLSVSKRFLPKQELLL
jgi:uncharacterized protein (TIGR02147 family)